MPVSRMANPAQSEPAVTKETINATSAEAVRIEMIFILFRCCIEKTPRAFESYRIPKKPFLPHVGVSLRTDVDDRNVIGWPCRVSGTQLQCAQFDKRCAPTAGSLVRVPEADHLRVFSKMVPDRASQCANAFAVNDSNTANSLFSTCLKISFKHESDFTRLKRVKIDLVGDRNPHRIFVLTHESKILAGLRREAPQR